MLASHVFGTLSVAARIPLPEWKNQSMSASYAFGVCHVAIGVVGDAARPPVAQRLRAQRAAVRGFDLLAVVGERSEQRCHGLAVGAADVHLGCGTCRPARTSTRKAAPPLNAHAIPNQLLAPGFVARPGRVLAMHAFQERLTQLEVRARRSARRGRRDARPAGRRVPDPPLPGLCPARTSSTTASPQPRNSLRPSTSTSRSASSCYDGGPRHRPLGAGALAEPCAVDFA